MSEVTDDQILTREGRIAQFGEEKVDHMEWLDEQRDLVDDVLEDMLNYVATHHDVQIARYGSTIKKSGKHEARFRLFVAGDPWGSDAENGDPE